MDELVIIFAVAVTILLLSAAAGRFYERRLTFRQHLAVAVQAYLISFGAVSVYGALSSHLNFPASLNGIVSTIGIIAAGILITVFARKHGITKTGRVGLGASVVLTVVVPALVFAAIYGIAK